MFKFERGFSQTEQNVHVGDMTVQSILAMK